MAVVINGRQWECVHDHFCKCESENRRCRSHKYNHYSFKILFKNNKKRVINELRMERLWGLISSNNTFKFVLTAAESLQQNIFSVCSDALIYKSLLIQTMMKRCCDIKSKQDKRSPQQAWRIRGYKRWLKV